MVETEGVAGALVADAQVLAEQRRVAGIGREQAAESGEQCALAGAGGTRAERQFAGKDLDRQIAAGEFAPLSRLPAERDLVAKLGVSRPSVREALIALEVEGWVEVRTGSGVYVLERPGHLNGAAASPCRSTAVGIIRRNSSVTGMSGCARWRRRWRMRDRLRNRMPHLWLRGLRGLDRNGSGGDGGRASRLHGAQQQFVVRGDGCGEGLDCLFEGHD